MTEKIYEKDSYCKEFIAKVLECCESGDFYRVVLDRTAFFPEGGGQAPDKGTLNGEEVLDVQIENNVIYHTVKKFFDVGTDLEGKIDWDLRFSRMQSHAGEHIVSGVVHSMFGYSNAGFHMGETTMTVDFSGPLTAEDIFKVELESNKAIYKNVAIYATYPTKEELSDLDYRSKIDPRDDMRLITIEGVDCCACCAPHPSRSGEIGLVKIIDFFPHRGGTRVEMIAGVHAFMDYAKLHNENKKLMGMLSASRDNVAPAVEKQMEQVASLRSENQKLSGELALSKLEPTMVGNSAYAILEGLSYDNLRSCANTLTDKGVEKCVLLSGNESDGYIYVVSDASGDVTGLVKAFNGALNGKGGGRGGFAQGKVSACEKDKIKSVLEELLK